MLGSTGPGCAETRGDSTGADLGQIVDLPVVVQRQVPMVLTLQRRVETPQLPQL